MRSNEMTAGCQSFIYNVTFEGGIAIISCDILGSVMLELWQQGHRVMRQGRQAFYWFSAQARHWPLILVRTIRATISHESSLTSAAIGYYTLFSLFPLMLLTVAIASLWLDPLAIEAQIVTQLEFIAPALGELLGANIERIVSTRAPVSGFALVMVVWSASNVFNVITQAMDRIWDVTPRRSGWRHRGLAIFMALLISGLLLAASIAEGTILTVVATLLPNGFQTIRPYTTRFWATLVNMVLFAVLYYFLPHKSLSWRDVLPGAVSAGLLWELAKRGFLYFIATYLSRSNLVYGSVATITVFLTWVYVSGHVFLFGAYLNVAYVQVNGNGDGDGFVSTRPEQEVTVR
ncbi:MAG: YihY/virulence factor BrkB family protein [Chloroflexi bacterium]|nr:MAG: YihY/virulence factor BrkB family protein [Chloroflexota bacterium]